ncbi:Uncharacterised protein [Vibrio cholerae]|nr:Uncharacterised protein [Vibrio cholerae]
MSAVSHFDRHEETLSSQVLDPLNGETECRCQKESHRP